MAQIADQTARADQVALLLPRTGSLAGLGLSMANAAELVTLPADGVRPRIFDAGDTPEMAVAAARMALESDTRLVFGPLRSEQAQAVKAETGDVPVVTFSNDERLAEDGIYVMGITPEQSVATMFTYARAQGLQRVAVLCDDTPFGRASIAAASQIAEAGGLDLVATLIRRPSVGGHLQALQAASGGQLPDAVYIPDGSPRLEAFSPGLAGQGVIIMGSVQWRANDLPATPLLDGSVFAAPPPDLFRPYSEQYSESYGSIPGLVATLAYDAALIGVGLAAEGQLSRRGLERQTGFIGALGPFTFGADRRARRSLAVLGILQGQLEVFAEIDGT